MKMKTLDEFLETNLSKPPGSMIPARAHVREKGFNTLYVRVSGRALDGKLTFPVIDFASMEVDKKGVGTFTRCVQRVRKMYPTLPIYVESVVNRRFAEYLPKIGFEVVIGGLSPCFLWRPSNEE